MILFHILLEVVYYENQDRTTILLYNKDRTARTGQHRQDSMDRIARKGRKHMTERT
jgi:hypothetical protein